MVEKTPADPEFETLLGHIQQSRGMDFRGYKRASLRRRIALRMEAVSVQTFAAYQAHLEVHPGEFEDLLNTVLINVTSFFRDEEAWAALRDQVIPEVVANAKDGRHIRVWSVGCASGEEPYSLAMLFAEALGVKETCERVKIYATDLDEEALKTARVATYLPRDVESVPPEYLERYFERSHNHYVFQRDLRKSVIFGRHNVVYDAPISRIDLLVCRNLLIYLESETQDIVLPRLHYALASDGYMFLGKAETQLARSGLFNPLEMKHRIFTKVPQEWRRPLNPGFGATLGSRPEASSNDPRLFELVLNEASTAFLVIDETGVVILANLAAHGLLGVGEPDVGRPFQDLPISYRPVELRAQIDAAFRHRRSVRLSDQEYRPTGLEAIRLTIDVRPLYRPDGSVHAVLLSFSDDTQGYGLRRELEVLQENLENSIEELQSANEELETTNEELQSTNEELETTNEELQSINEELETLNEEARSSNEEMESVNEELRLQGQQATSYRLHLESVLRAMNGGVIVIDARNRVQGWNRWNEATWGPRTEEAIGVSLDALDIGLPVHRLRAEVELVQSGRAEYAEQVLEGLDRRGRPIICRVRISPLLDDAGDGHGVVILFQDITEERRAEDYSQYLGRVMDTALGEICFLTPDTLAFRQVNQAARRGLGYSQAQLTKMNLLELIEAPDRQDLKTRLETLVAGGEDEIVFSTSLRTQDASRAVQMAFRYFAKEVPPMLMATLREPE
ncbi:CheR family methyltransferase [Caulobacter sp. DWR1-3-2b1]|uniref:CheR family methyltransferase n=1 Tax=Caulobacter sp. DWR1-3-2b1 TaxID=2804670 RepID=UPI003CFBABB5